jgi:hypothetical protein
VSDGNEETGKGEKTSDEGSGGFEVDEGRVWPTLDDVGVGDSVVGREAGVLVEDEAEDTAVAGA